MIALWHLEEILKRRQYARMHDEAVLNTLKAGLKTLRRATNCNSLLKKYLTKDVFAICSNRRTLRGATLLDVIQSGVENLNCEIGVYTPDPDSYFVFQKLLDPVITELHKCDVEKTKQPLLNFGTMNEIGNLDNTFVRSVRIRCVRNLKGFAFNCLLKENEYLEIEREVSHALSFMEGSLSGTYYPFSSLDKPTKQRLIKKRLLYQQHNQLLESARGYEYFPTGRGIFYNEQRNFFAWLNEEDHLRIIVMEQSAKLRKLYELLIEGIKKLEQLLSFVKDDYLGYLTFSPTNLGVAFKVSVYVNLPILSSLPNKLADIAKKFDLTLKMDENEDEVANNITYEVTSQSRIGMTEFDTIKNLYDGVLNMIEEEVASS